MGKPNYRVLVSFDRDRSVFHARTHELEHLSGEGPTRAEAIARLEEEIDAQLANMLSSGTPPPRALDDVDYSGEVQAKISRGLHRDLAHLARAEGVELGQIVSELLSAAMAQRQGAGRGGAQKARALSIEPSDDIGNRADGNRHDGNRHDGNRRGFGRGGMHSGALDDRAHFIEYVRGLENGQGGQGGGPGANGGPRGGGHPGHPGGGRRHRRGGRGGQQCRDGNRGPMQQGRGTPSQDRGPHDGANGASPSSPPALHHDGNHGEG